MLKITNSRVLMMLIPVLIGMGLKSLYNMNRIKDEMDWPSFIFSQVSHLFVKDLYPPREQAIGFREGFNQLIARGNCANHPPLCNLSVPQYPAKTESQNLSHLKAIWDFSNKIVTIRVYEPIGSHTSNKKIPVIVWLHGGGFAIGTHKDDYNCLNLANSTAAIVISVAYRLSPESPFPAGQDDAIAAIRWISSSPYELRHINADTSRIIVVGESAGGHHAAASALQVAMPAVKGLVLLYPMVDHQLPKHDSEIKFANINGILTQRQAEWFWKLYLGIDMSDQARYDLARTNPRVNLISSSSKVMQRVKKVRTLVMLARYDVLYSEGRALAEHFLSHGVDITVREYPTIHGFWGIDAIPSAGKARQELEMFVRATFEAK